MFREAGELKQHLEPPASALPKAPLCDVAHDVRRENHMQDLPKSCRICYARALGGMAEFCAPRSCRRSLDAARKRGARGTRQRCTRTASFTMGLIGTVMPGVPALAGASAYDMGEAMLRRLGWTAAAAMTDGCRRGHVHRGIRPVIIREAHIPMLSVLRRLPPSAATATRCAANRLSLLHLLHLLLVALLHLLRLLLVLLFYLLHSGRSGILSRQLLVFLVLLLLEFLPVLVLLCDQLVLLLLVLLVQFGVPCLRRTGLFDGRQFLRMDRGVGASSGGNRRRAVVRG